MKKKTLIIAFIFFIVVIVYCLFIYTHSIQALKLPEKYQLEWDTSEEAMAHYPWNDYRYAKFIIDGKSIKDSCNVINAYDFNYTAMKFSSEGVDPSLNISPNNLVEYNISGSVTCGFDLKNLFDFNKSLFPLPILAQDSGKGFATVLKKPNGKWYVQGVGSGP